MNQEKLYLYQMWIRLWHLINAVLCLILMITGISMQFSSKQVTIVQFDSAVTIHNLSGIILIINYVFFFIGNFITSNGRYYQFSSSGLFYRLKKQVIYYTHGVLNKETPPFPINKDKKFNPLQQFTYVIVMYIFVPIILISGLALLYPETIPVSIMYVSGLHFIDFLHILSGFIVSMFMFIHIYFCTIGKSPLSNFKSIINGYHETY